MQHNYSILRPVVARPFCVALAQLMANARPGDNRWPMWRRMFNELSPADKLRCEDELRWCRAAKRGAVEAQLQCAS
jgi:hypothetical protein